MLSPCKKIIVPVLLTLLVGSILFNFYQASRPVNGPDIIYIDSQDQQADNIENAPVFGIFEFHNANSRETYFTTHNVKAAHAVCTGQGIKVGVMDWCFGYGTHSDLYEDIINFTGKEFVVDEEEHGLWMTTTLRETAPHCTMCTTEKIAPNAMAIMAIGER